MRGVGYTNGLEYDDSRPDWDGTSARPLAWSAWYPCGDSDDSEHRAFGGLFDLGAVRTDGPIAADAPCPVVLLSHGTGGSPESLGWLASRLAEAGQVVIGAHHHGNTAREPYCPEGFLCWWERAADLSALLTKLSDHGPFAGRLDTGRVSAVGFSLGAYTVRALAGALTSMERFTRWASTAPRLGSGSREMPGVGSHAARLLVSSVPFRESWSRQSRSYLNRRVRSVVALAPPPPVRGFDADTVARLSLPVTLITGEADEEAPSADCANWLVRANPRFQRVSIGATVGHYTFLGCPAGEVPEEAAFLFQDHPDLDREEVHARTAQIVLASISPNG
jgi:predicted dienelactone hydrolase